MNSPLQLNVLAGRGIGNEVATLLSKMGANVVVCSRTQSEIDSVVNEIKRMMTTDSEALLFLFCPLPIGVVEHTMK